MPSLLDNPYADPGQNSRSLLGLDMPRIAQPDPDTDQGAALAATYKAITDEMARQQQISADRGLWDDTTGLPTGKGLVSAGQQYAGGLLMGTTAPGARAVMDNPAFTDWFGNSKVVNEAGAPLTVYHGTKADIGQFDASMGKSKTDAPSWATFFTDDPALASSYARRSGPGANVVPAHLSLQNPLETTGRSWFALESPLEGTVWSPRYGQYVTIRRGDEIDINQLSSMAKDQGYDGLIARNVPDTARPSDKDRPQTTYVAFHPTQIKSAIGNRGTYSPTDPRIAYGVGGLSAGGAAASQYRRDE